MIFSGSELAVQRNFYTQTGNLGFGLTCLVDNTTGRYAFGLSGSQNTVEFVLESGKIYHGSRFLHAYQADEAFSFEVQTTTGSINVIKDGHQIVYGLAKETGNYDYFYFNRENTSLGAEFDLFVSGDNLPSRTISTQGYFSYSGQSGVTGYYVNNGAYPITVFNSTILATQNYTFGRLATTVPAGGTGVFVYSGDFQNFDLTQPILTTFRTNYGSDGVLFYINDTASADYFVYLTSPTTFTFNSSNQLSSDIAYLNYSGGFVTNVFQTDLVIQLRYATGQQTFTGVWNMSTGFDPTSLVSFYDAGTYNTGLLSGAATLPANSGIAFQISYSGISGNAAQLVISGANVSNPINTSLSFVATS